MAGSPQSILSPWSASGKGSPNVLSLGVSPPSTAFEQHKDDAWDLLYAAAEHVTRLTKLNDQGNHHSYQGSGLLCKPSPPISAVSKAPGTGYYHTPALTQQQLQVCWCARHSFFLPLLFFSLKSFFLGVLGLSLFSDHLLHPLVVVSSQATAVNEAADLCSMGEAEKSKGRWRGLWWGGPVRPPSWFAVFGVAASSEVEAATPTRFWHESGFPDRWRRRKGVCRHGCFLASESRHSNRDTQEARYDSTR